MKTISIKVKIKDIKCTKIARIYYVNLIIYLYKNLVSLIGGLSLKKHQLESNVFKIEIHIDAFGIISKPVFKLLPRDLNPSELKFKYSTIYPIFFFTNSPGLRSL